MGYRNSNLKRTKAKRAPRRRFIIYCEGEKTEPAYFDALKQTFGRDALVELEIVPTGVPKTIAERAVARAKAEGLAKRSRKPKNSFEDGDQVWAVFDRDEHPNFEDAVAICSSKGVGIGRSNPCFEIWLILHEEEYDRADNRRDVCRHLRTLRPEYDPKHAKCCNCNEMVVRAEVAEARAERLLRLRESQGWPFGRPSTTVGLLTSAMRAAANAAKRK